MPRIEYYASFHARSSSNGFGACWSALRDGGRTSLLERRQSVSRVPRRLRRYAPLPKHMKSHFVLALAVANLALTQAFSQAPAPFANPGVPWGEPLEGVSVRLRADKTNWGSNEIATFKLDVRNQGQREFYAVQSQVTGRLEVDGVCYGWTGGINLELSPLTRRRWWCLITPTSRRDQIGNSC
jgi:hypothetical protein